MVAGVNPTGGSVQCEDELASPMQTNPRFAVFKATERVSQDACFDYQTPGRGTALRMEKWLGSLGGGEAELTSSHAGCPLVGRRSNLTYSKYSY